MNQITVLIFVLIFSARANAIGNDSNKMLQNKIANILNEVKVADTFKVYASSILNNEEKSLETTELLSLLSEEHDSVEAKNRFQVMLSIWLYENRNDGNKLGLMYDKMPAKERSYYFALINILLEDFYTPDFYILGEKMLSDTIDAVNEPGKDRLQVSALNSESQMIVSFMADTKSDKSLPIIYDLLTHRVVDYDQRFNIVASVANHWGASGAKVVNWYFERYAFTSFEIEVFSEYFTKNLTEEIAQQMLDAKREELSEALISINRSKGLALDKTVQNEK